MLLIRHIAMVTFLIAIVSAPAHAQEISSVEVMGLSSLSDREVKDVVGIKKGDPYSSVSIEKAISNLRKWGVFDTIEVSPEITPQGAAIHFHLKEAIVVVSVDIDGNYPYIENKIRKYLTLHPGDIYTPDKLADQIERIKTFYAREGYVGTEVYVDEDLMPEFGGVILTFHIRRGYSLRYRSIDVSGNRAYPRGRFVSMLETWNQFSERRLAQSLRNIKSLYQNHGYPKARIRIKQKHIDFETRRIDIALEVLEGPYVDISFKGAYRTNDKQLKKAVTVLREGSVDSYEIERSVEAIKELLRNRGYPYAQVSPEKRELPDGTIAITFWIDEKQEWRIKRLSFPGSGEVNKDALEVNMVNRAQAFKYRGAFYPEDESKDNEAILKAMRRGGYLDASVGNWDVRLTKQGHALDVAIPIVKGQQTLVGEISFDGNLSFPSHQLLKELKIRPGKPLDEPSLEDDRQHLITFYADNGYPYAEIKQSWNSNNEGKAIIKYDISEGVKVTIGHVLIIGDVMTSQKAIKNAMSIHRGDPFSYRRIIESQLTIRRLGPFAAVNIETIGLEERESIVHLKVKVEEEKPFQVDLGLSYSTAEKLTGSFTFRNLNAFGWAKTNALKLTAGQWLSRAEILWYDPRFVGSSFEMTSNAWVQYKKRPTYAFSQIGGALGWFKRLELFGLYFRWELNRNYFVSGDSAAADADSLRNNTISRISLSGSFDSRDNFSDPRKGFFTQGGVDIYNEIKGNDADFFRFSWQGENDLTALDRITLTTELRFARIQTLHKNVSVPTNELLFLGGDDTIRGFSEDSLGPQDANGQAVGARLRWITNEELRIRLWKTLQWAFFYDMGSLTDTFSQIGWRTTVRKSFGFGLRYTTPVGPIRADYGIKLDRKTGETFGRFHFTFGYVF